MNRDSEKLGLRILKYKDYISKYPDKAYGHYCLGSLYLMDGQYKAGEKCFLKALALKAGYVPALIGIIEAALCQKKLLKAVNLYTLHSSSIKEKKVFMAGLIKKISSHFMEAETIMKPASLLASILFKYEMFAMNALYKKDPANEAANIILCMNYFTEKNMSDKAVVVYNTCVLLDGLDDVMRWELVKLLSQEDPSIYHNTEIAAKFASIPDTAIASKYADTLFERALFDFKADRFKKLSSSFKGLENSLSLKNQWKYLKWCKDNSYYNSLTVKCCRRLIKSGWVDSLIADSVEQLKRHKLAGSTEHEDHILELFGYKK